MIRILVVDDKTALVELVQSYLESEQYEVLTADDGRAALEPLEGQFAEKGLLLHFSCLKADEVALPCVPKGVQGTLRNPSKTQAMCGML